MPHLFEGHSKECVESNYCCYVILKKYVNFKNIYSPRPRSKINGMISGIWNGRFVLRTSWARIDEDQQREDFCRMS